MGPCPASSSRDLRGRGDYNRPVSRHYSLDEANALLPELRQVVERLRDERTDLVALRDAWRLRAGVDAELAPGAGGEDEDAELRRLRLRMRGIMDQMQADVAWMDERAIVLRDIETGLLDFPGLAGDREVWLCWRAGEDRVDWWHGTDDGFAGRRPANELAEGSASHRDPGGA